MSLFSMKRGRRILLIVAACGVIAVVTALVWPVEKEPEYHGKRLSEWIEGGFRHDEPGRAEEQERVVRHIGTNALPFLIRGVASADKPKSVYIEDLVARANDRAGSAVRNFRWRRFRRAEETAW